MGSTRCMIVDGDRKAGDILESYIKRSGSSRLMARSESAIEAAAVLRRIEVDLLFVEMKLPDMGGAQFVETLCDSPELILSSDQSEDALEAFEADALDFLLKPCPFDRFMKALNRYYLRRGPAKERGTEGELIPRDALIYLEEGSRTHRIPVGAICYVEALSDRIRIQTDGLPLMVKNHMDRVAEILAPWPFLRISRDLLVSIPRISSFSPSTVELSHASFSIGRSYKEQVIGVLQNQI